jgi:UDPglucose 6-dehydrogenase
MKISIVGLGKLGAPIVAVLAAKGYEVTGIDIDSAFVEKMNNHIAPVEEPHLQDLLTKHKARISATSDWSKAILGTDVTGVIVPTPSGPNGAFHNEYILSAMDAVGRVLAAKKDYHLVIVHSTTMPGSVGGPIKDRLQRASGRKVGPDLGLCYNPEFVALGDVIEGLLHPDFVLIGESDKKAGDILEGMYRRAVGPKANVVRMNLVNAELTKISINTYVAMKISFANMLGEICDRLEGSDVQVIADALGRDTRIGKKYFKPAIGYGGPCFPRDTIAFGRIAQMVGADADLALSSDLINRRQIKRLGDIIKSMVPSCSTIAVLGLSYKPNTPVIEESQGIMLAKALLDSGFKVVAHDPMAAGPAQAVLGKAVAFARSPRGALTQADAAVVTTPWADYATITPDWISEGKLKVIIDCWGQIKPETFKDICKVVHLGHRSTLAASVRQEAAE